MSSATGNRRIRQVKSFEELFDTPFSETVNALCWERTLPGDFRQVSELLGIGEGIVVLEEERLRNLPVNGAGRVAIEAMLEDLRRLQKHNLEPVLNCIYPFPTDSAPPTHEPFVPDVFSFHVDTADIEADTWLCTYHGAASEGLSHEEAIPKVEIPEIRAALLRCFGGKEGSDFETFLAENYYNLHYAPIPGAQPFSFGMGNLWRIATQWQGSIALPCIHRAPRTVPGDPARLLLIS